MTRRSRTIHFVPTTRPNPLDPRNRNNAWELGHLCKLRNPDAEEYAYKSEKGVVLREAGEKTHLLFRSCREKTHDCQTPWELTTVSDQQNRPLLHLSQSDCCKTKGAAEVEQGMP